MRIRYLLLLFLFCGAAQAQTLVSGEITTTTWDTTGNPYLVVGDVTVPAGEYLTILAGVKVWFGFGDTLKYKITIEGGMNAWGTENDSVEFAYIYYPAPGMWQYIKYENASSDSAILNYCIIESGDRAVYATDCQVTLNHCSIRRHGDEPIRGLNAHFDLHNCTIANNEESALLLANTSANLIECVITASSGYYGRGISASSGGTLFISGGYIGNNAGHGIYGSSLDGITLDQVEIAENDVAGIYLTLCGQLDASRVLIHNNGYHGIFLSSTSMEAHNLTVSSNAGYGIYCFNGDLELTSSIMDRNEDWGVYCQSGSNSLNYNDAYLNDSGNYFSCAPGDSSIEEDPLYVSLPFMDFNLQDGSPCIDAGSPSDPLDPDGTRTDMGAFFYNQAPVVPWTEPGTISAFKIVDAFPNPFNPVLNIRVQARRPGPGTIEAWTAQGRLAARIWEGQLLPGLNEFIWRADHFASGTYYLHLKAGETTATLPCILVK